MDLWHQLIGLMHFHTISFVKIKGHSGDYWNERADKLAGIARLEKKELENVSPNFDFPMEIKGYTWRKDANPAS